MSTEIANYKQNLENLIKIELRKINQANINGIINEISIKEIIRFNLIIISPENETEYRFAEKVSFNNSIVRTEVKVDDSILSDIYNCNGYATINYNSEEYKFNVNQISIENLNKQY